jgi:hypothetical protein
MEKENVILNLKTKSIVFVIVGIVLLSISNINNMKMINQLT